MTYEAIPVSGINPHSIDRAGDTNKFYIRTQNSNSFDVVNFQEGTTKTVDLVDHRPRAIGAPNLKYKIQLLSVKDMPMVDVIDTRTDRVLISLGDRNYYDSAALTSNAGSGSATGHSFWLDEDHFALIDRVHSKVIVYKVSLSGGVLHFSKRSSIDTKTALHAIERVKNKKNSSDAVTFYGLGEGDITKSINPYLVEFKFHPSTGVLSRGRETDLNQSTAKRGGKNPTTHHAGISPDGQFIYVPVFDGKVYIINRATMAIVNVVTAGFGAAHIEFSSTSNVAVVTNHFDQYVTVIDTRTQKTVKNIKITDHVFHDHLLQPHFSYMSKDGKYFYTFSTQDGDFLKINLETLEIEDTLHTGGAPEQAHS